jgi:hypothetical protein
VRSHAPNCFALQVQSKKVPVLSTTITWKEQLVL